jgi:PAS domain S-box-containing protein
MSPRELTKEQLNQRYDLLVQSVADYAIYLLDCEGHVVSWNTGAQNLKGYSADEIVGRHFSTFYSREEIEADIPNRNLQIALREGHYTAEGWRFRKDGTRFWASVVITPLFDAGGEHVGYSKITRDLTERRAAEERYRLLVTAVRDYAIFMLDTEGHVASWNIGAERMLGYRTEEALGKPLSIFYTPQDRDDGRVDEELRRARETAEARDEGWRVRKDGSLFWASVVVTAIRDYDGTLLGYAKVTRDTTEQRRLSEQLAKHAAELEHRTEQLQKRSVQLQEINASMEAFTYSVSHDLRAPLRGIWGYVNALVEDFGPELPDGAKSYCEQIINSARRMDDLITDLLAYSRLNTTEVQLTDVDLREVVDDVLAALDAQIKESHADIVTGGLCAVRAHAPSLRQALANLISNAIKFVPADVTPKISIYAERHAGKHVRIWVIDNGIGVEPQHHERIFRPFERLHGVETYRGTGIGLAVVAKAVERMGGTYGIESEPGKGSRFWIELPDASTEMR